VDHCTDGNVSGGAPRLPRDLTVLRYTTMRPGELRKLQWDYVQWDANRIVFSAPRSSRPAKRREVVMIDSVKKNAAHAKRRELNKEA